MTKRSFSNEKENPASGAGSEEAKIGAQSINADDKQPLSTSQAAMSVDLETATAFLARFDPVPTAFRTFTDAKGADKPKGRDKLARNLHCEFADCGPELARLNDQGAGVYFVVNAGGQKREDIERVRALFVDLDGSPLDPVLRLTLPPHVVIETSAGRYHAYWLVEGFPLEQFTAAQQLLAHHFKGDPSVTDLPRVMRVPGFRHRSGFRLRVVHEIDAAPYDGKLFIPRDDMKSAAPADEGGISLAPETIEDLRSALAALDPGDRDQWQKNAHRLKEIGLHGFLLWDEWAQRSAKHDPHDSLRVWKSAKPTNTSYRAVFSDAQAAGWINSAQMRALERRSAKLPKRQRSRGLSFTRIDRLDMEPVAFAIDGWLAQESTAAIIGASGTGKSFLAIDWSLCIASGRAWWGRAVNQGPVFYIAGEGVRGIRKRCEAWSVYHGVPLGGLPFYLAGNMPDLSSPEGAQVIIEAVNALAEEHGQSPALIVIDTLARALHGESDNDAKTMNGFGACLDVLREEWSATVLAIHHTGHDNGHRARGHSGFTANLDSWYLMQGNGIGYPTQLTSAKEKDWPPPDQLSLALKQIVAGAETSCVLENVGAANAQRLQTEEQKRQHVMQLKAAGKKLREIEAETGVPRSSISRWTRAGGLGEAGA